MDKIFNSLIFFVSFFICYVHSQEIPTFSFDYHKKLFDHDLGKNWNTLSTFLPANYGINTKKKRYQIRFIRLCNESWFNLYF